MTMRLSMTLVGIVTLLALLALLADRQGVAMRICQQTHAYDTCFKQLN